MAWSPSASRPLRFRRRHDVFVAPVTYADRRLWSVKDPVSLRYYQLREEEFRIYQLLDRPISLDEIRERFEKEFAPRRISLQHLQSFLGMLHTEGLLIVDAPGQWQPLLEQQKSRSRRQRLEQFSNPLAIRFRGFDPNRLLNLFWPFVRWVFHPVTVTLAILLAISAALLLAVQWQTVAARLPDFEAFFGLRNALLMAVMLGVAKVIHEFGHAFACRRYGGEVPEMGLMFLVFTPCLYVNVSDAWLLPNKWHRIIISSAGMFVEMVLASVCVFLWWFSVPGLLNTLCLNMVFICSVNTVLFNGNPLLRYDGYFVLADWLEVPNLRQQATALVKQKLCWFFLGIHSQNTRFVPEQRRKLIGSYWVLSTVYRLMVLVTILWFVHEVLKPYRLEILAGMLAMLVIGGMIVKPVWTVFKFVRDPWKMREVAVGRLVIRGSAVLGLVALALLTPLPHRVSVPVVVQPADAKRVYVSVGGVLAESRIENGSQVKAGDVLAQLENGELRREIVALEGKLSQQQAKANGLQQLQLIDRTAQPAYNAAKEVLLDLERQLKERNRDYTRLTLVAPATGTILPPAPKEAGNDPGAMPEWTGTPLEERNQFTFLPTGSVLCQIGDPDRLEAVLIIDQADVDRIAAGQRVKLVLDEQPGRILTGQVMELAQIDVKVAPRQLLRHEDLPSRTSADGQTQLVNTSYQARVAFDVPPTLLIGCSGTAYVETASSSLGSRLLRYLNRTFRFEL